jgi:hypothetical protein
MARLGAREPGGREVLAMGMRRSEERVRSQRKKEKEGVVLCCQRKKKRNKKKGRAKHGREKKEKKGKKRKRENFDFGVGRIFCGLNRTVIYVVISFSSLIS